MSIVSEVNIYNNYRNALRAAVGGHAAQRRNYARKVTVNRYNVSFKEVKDIVAKFDALYDIKHEHTEAYVQQLTYETATRNFEANPVPCGCGSTVEVKVRVNPYEIEINGVFKLMTSCFACWQEVKWDI